MTDTKREPRYTIRLTATAANITRMRDKVLAMDPGAAAQIAKVERDPTRADRLAWAMSLVADALSDVEDLRGEIEAWKDALPENLQDGDKASQLEECMDALSALVDALEQADGAASEVSFPGMR